MLEDLRTAVRWLRGDRHVTLLIIVTIGLGVGANAAVYGALDGVLRRPFRFQEGDRTVLIWRGAVGKDLLIPPLAEQIELWRSARAFERIEPFSSSRVTWTGGAEPVQVNVARTLPTLAQTFGHKPAAGRYFTDADARASEPIALISYHQWQQRYAGERSALGQAVVLNGVAHTLVGVLPADFELPSPGVNEVDFVIPLKLEDGNTVTAAGVLREDVTAEQAEAELTLLSRNLPGQNAASQWTARVLEPSYFARGMRDTLILLSAAVSALLLIVVTNVANLLLSRAQARDREMAIRTALGAQRERLFRQVLLNATLLGLLGGGAGLLLALWGRDLLLGLRPSELQVLDRMTIDARVLGFGLLVSIVTGVLFGIAPALHAARYRNLDLLRSGTRSEGSMAARRFRIGLVVAQVALAFTILVGAGLLLRSTAALLRSDPGFNTTNLALLELSLPEWKYETPGQQAAFYQETLERLRAYPGVQSAALAGGVPPRSGVFFGDLEIDGRGPVEDMPVLYGTSAGAEYFRTLQLQIVQGRAFTQDDMISDKAWIIGESTARRLFPAGDAVGKRMRLSAKSEWSTIVGVAGDVRATGLTDAIDQPQMYQPLSEVYSSQAVVVRTSTDVQAMLPALQREIQALDRDVLVANARTIDGWFEQSIGRDRFALNLLSVFAGLAVALATIGLYGVLLSLVRQRTREIGIRMALGADHRRVVGMVLRQGGLATMGGIVIGIPLAFWGTKLLGGQLHGVGRVDPVTYAGAATLFAAVAFIATWLPARRAARVQPLDVMRPD